MQLKTTKQQIDRVMAISDLCATDGIYSTLYVKATDKLVLGAGDSDIAQILVTLDSIDTEVLEPGGCRLDAKLLKKIWTSIPEGGTTWETRGGKLYIKQEENNWSVSIGNIEDYPLVSQTAEVIDTISLVDLASAVNMVSFAVGNEKSRPILNAINLNKGTFTATNGVKLAQMTTSMTGLDLTFSSSIQTVTKILTKITNSDQFQFGMGNTWVQLKSDNVEVWVATVGLDYPTTAIDLIRNLQDLPPQSAISIPIREIIPIVQAANAIYSKSRSCDGLTILVDNGLKLSLEGDAGSLSKHYDFTSQGTSEIWVNPGEFEEILRATPTEILDIKIYSEQRPLVGFVENLPWGCALAPLRPPTRPEEEELDYEPDF